MIPIPTFFGTYLGIVENSTWEWLLSITAFRVVHVSRLNHREDDFLFFGCADSFANLLSAVILISSIH